MENIFQSNASKQKVGKLDNPYLANLQMLDTATFEHGPVFRLQYHDE